MRTAARLAKRLRRLPRCPIRVARSETTVADSGEIMLPPLASHPVAPRGSVLLHSARFPLPLALPLFPLFTTKLDCEIFQPFTAVTNAPARSLPLAVVSAASKPESPQRKQFPACESYR